MKKTLLMIVAITGLMTFAACGNKSTANSGDATENEEQTGVKFSLCNNTYEGDSLMIQADVWYPENAGIEDMKRSTDYAARKTLCDSTENWGIEIYLHESGTYEHNKKSDAEDKSETFTEFKIGNYDAYAYSSVRTYYMHVLFEKVSETTFRFMDIEIRQLKSDSDGPGGKEFFEQNENVKHIINSIRFKGVVPKTVEIK